MRERYADACTTNIQSAPAYFPGKDKMVIAMTGGSLAPRDATNYEACFFIFEIDRDVWKAGA